MDNLIIDERLTDRLSRVQTDLAFLQMQLAQSDEERQQHYEVFLEFLNRMTRRPRTKSGAEKVNAQGT